MRSISLVIPLHYDRGSLSNLIRYAEELGDIGVVETAKNADFTVKTL